jgi:hypothetical protein
MQYIIKYDSTVGSSCFNTDDFFKVDLSNSYIVENCLHKNCSRCGGTGICKDTHEICIHMISCSCSMCSPKC